MDRHSIIWFCRPCLLTVNDQCTMRANVHSMMDSKRLVSPLSIGVPKSNPSSSPINIVQFYGIGTELMMEH